MTIRMRGLFASAFAALAIAAPSQVVSTTGSVLFGTRAHETVFSGIGGTQAFPNNENGVINRYGVSIATPSAVPRDASEVVNFGALVAFYGDTNSDGVHAENPDHGGSDAIDAIWVPGSIGSPVRWCDFFYSAGTDLGGGGGLAGVPVTATEMIRIRANGPPLKLYTEAQLEILLGMAPGGLASANVDGFAKDPATGNLYLGFTASLQINGGSVAVAPGDLVEIAGTHYTAVGPYGVVSAPVGGGARVAVPAAEFQGIIAALGVALPAGVLQLRDVDLDPAGGIYANAAGSIPDMLFVVDTTFSVSGTAAPAIYTTQGGGGFAVVNGVAMKNPRALGLNPISFNTVPCGSLDVLDIVAQVQARLPLGIDRFPNASGGTNPVSPVIPTPGPLTFGIAGVDRAGPGAYVFVGASPAGAGTAAFRTDASAFGLQGSCLLQVDIAQDPLFSYFSTSGASLVSPNPVKTTGAYATFTIQVPVNVPAGFMVVVQAVDLSDLTLSNANAVRL